MATARQVQGACTSLAIEFVDEVERPAHLERRMQLLIQRINAIIPDNIVPESLTVRLATTSDAAAMNAHASSTEGNEYISVPSRFYNHLPPGNPIRMSLKDSDAIIAHEYGHRIFDTAVKRRGNSQAAAIETELDKTQLAITILQRRIDAFEADAHELAKSQIQQQHPEFMSSFEQLMQLENEKYRIVVSTREKFEFDSPEVKLAEAAYDPVSVETDGARSRYQELLAEYLKEIRKDPKITRLRLEMGKIRDGKYPEVLRRYRDLLNYHELFADVVAVFDSQDPTVLGRVLTDAVAATRQSRDFTSVLSPKDWTGSECHDFFAPVRSFIGSKVLPKVSSPEERKAAINTLTEVLIVELNSIAVKSIDIAAMSVAERNEMLVRRLALRFEVPVP